MKIILFLIATILTISAAGQITRTIMEHDSMYNSYDPELETPDRNNLTPLGCLLYHPWAYHMANDSDGGYNVAIYYNNKEVSSTGFPYSDLQKNIVFEFQRNGSLKYWFKKDYIKSAIDTITLSDGSKGLSHNIVPAYNLPLKEIYTSGSWRADFKDSSIKIDFGKNNLSLLPFEGKYTVLGSAFMAFEQTMPYDSLINGKKRVYKKVINTYYDPY